MSIKSLGAHTIAILGLFNVPMEAITDATAPKLVLTVSAFDSTTNQPIANGQTIALGDMFSITVTTNGVNCAGQFVVSALGGPGNAPAVLVQVVPFIIGPATGGNSVESTSLSAGVLPSGKNDFKVSASCNGARKSQFGFGELEIEVSGN